MILKVDSNNYKSEVLDSDKPVLLGFSATWCGPCKRVTKVLEELDADGVDVKIAKLDIEDCPDIAVKNGIANIPVLVYYRGGQEVGRLVGAKSKDAVLDLLSK